VQIKFPVTSTDLCIDRLESSVECNIFLSEKSLETFIFQMPSLEKMDPSKDLTCPYFILSKKQKWVEEISVRYDRLKERWIVIEFVQKAHNLLDPHLFLSPKEVQKQAQDLQAAIDGYVESFRPSKSHMKYLRYAKRLILEALNDEAFFIQSPSKEEIATFRERVPNEISLETFAFAENLYELASYLFQKNILAFESMLATHFSENEIKELIFHITLCESSLSKISKEGERLKIIQGILGFAHSVTDYYVNETPYPNIEEIKVLFSTEIL